MYVTIAELSSGRTVRTGSVASRGGARAVEEGVGQSVSHAQRAQGEVEEGCAVAGQMKLARPADSRGFHCTRHPGVLPFQLPRLGARYLKADVREPALVIHVQRRSRPIRLRGFDTAMTQGVRWRKAQRHAG